MRLHLPVSGASVVLRQPAGAEDVLLSEAVALDMGLAVQLLSMLVSGGTGDPVDFLQLPVTDLETVLLRLRQWMFGDLVRSDVTCQTTGCSARVDIGFRLTDYLAHHTPRQAPGASAGPQTPWWSFDDGRIQFRAPTVADHLSARDPDNREREMRRRCVQPEDLPPEDLERVGDALDLMAPSLFSELEGTCPECGQLVTATFDPVSYVLRELGRQASTVYQEIHLLALSYHWAERDILALPRRRRAQYAELVQSGSA